MVGQRYIQSLVAVTSGMSMLSSMAALPGFIIYSLVLSRKRFQTKSALR